MNDFFGFVVVVGLLLLMINGVIDLAFDYRAFNAVARECNERGYVQSKTTRIICHIEGQQR